MPKPLKRKPFNERTADEHWESEANYWEWFVFINKITAVVLVATIVLLIAKGVV